MANGKTNVEKSGLQESFIYLLRVVGASGAIAMTLEGIIQHIGQRRPDLSREAVRNILSHLIALGYLAAEADGYLITEKGSALLA